MPFDSAGFPPERQEPKRVPISDNALCVGIVFIALSLLVIPISVPAFVDIIRYIRGH